MKLDKIFGLIVGIIFSIVFIGALGDVIIPGADIQGFYAFILAFSVLAIIFAFLEKILKEFGA